MMLSEGRTIYVRTNTRLTFATMFIAKGIYKLLEGELEVQLISSTKYNTN